jgi:sulfate adenylyltransferase
MKGKQMEQITPHGGKLINRVLEGAERETILEGAAVLPAKQLTDRELSDIDMIAAGGLSPLEGFMNKENYESVVESTRLINGLAWSIPINLSMTKEEAAAVKEGQDVRLDDATGTPIAILHLESKYEPDKEKEAQNVYKTTESAHPGVAVLKETGDVYLGGKVTVLNRVHYNDFPRYRLDPAQTRAAFKANEWETIVGFQTRNPIHRAHEFITKCALESVDGLLIHPLVGATKADDISAEVRMKCYEVLMGRYYATDHVMLSVLPAAMRYAGPKEAIHHAIMRQNYGCTHFIVGRDHAGVGNYYGTYDAQQIFKEFSHNELQIQPMCFEHSFFCKRNGEMATAKTSGSSAEERFFLSGTKVREMLLKGETPPPEFTRPEVAAILIDSMQK